MNSIFSRTSMLVAIALLASCGNATASDWVVLEVSGTTDLPKRGAILSETHLVNLHAGHEIVAIHRDGTVSRISGPYSGVIGGRREIPAAQDGSADKTAIGVVSDLLTENNGLISTLGSTRDPETGKPFNFGGDPWKPHIGAVATYCVDRKEPTIRRQNTTKPVRVTLVSPDFKILEQVWPKGQDALPLDVIGNRLPPSYDLLFSDRPGRYTLIVRPAEQSENNVEQIKWMAEVGCKAQALQMVEQLLGQHN